MQVRLKCQVNLAPPYSASSLWLQKIYWCCANKEKKKSEVCKNMRAARRDEYLALSVSLPYPGTAEKCDQIIFYRPITYFRYLSAKSLPRLNGCCSHHLLGKKGVGFNHHPLCDEAFNWFSGTNMQWAEAPFLVPALLD